MAPWSLRSTLALPIAWLLVAPLARAEPPACRFAVGEATTRAVFEALRAASDGECRLESVQTARHRVDLRWSTPTGERRATLWPAACAPSGSQPVGGGFAVAGHPCPSALNALQSLDAVDPPARETASDERATVDVASSEPAWTPESVYVVFVLPVLWALFLGLALVVAWRTWRARPPPRWGGLLGIAAITALALTLRVLLGTFSQGDMWDNTQEAYEPEAPRGFDIYGRSPEALLRLLFLVFPAGHDTFIAINLTAATLSVPLLYAFTRRLGLGSGVGHAAALLLAVSPLHVRFATTTNRYMVLIALTLAAWVLLMGWLEQRRRLDLAAAAVALGLAVQMRPEALTLPVFTVGLVLAWRLEHGRGSLRGRARELLVASAAWCAMFALPISHAAASLAGGRWTPNLEGAAVGRPIFDAGHNAFLSSLYTPWPWVLLAIAGLVAPPGHVRWRRAWLVGTALAASWVACVHTVDVNLWATRYQLLPLPLYFVVAAAGLAWLSRPRAIAIAAVAAATAAAPLLPWATRETTETMEYRFVRTHLRDIPDGCRVYTYVPGHDAGLAGARSLSLSSGRDHVWVANGAEREAPADCRILYVAANCDHATTTSQEAADQDRWCREPFRSATPEQLGFARLPRRPSVVSSHGYRSEAIPVGFYRLTEPVSSRAGRYR